MSYVFNVINTTDEIIKSIELTGNCKAVLVMAVPRKKPVFAAPAAYRRTRRPRAPKYRRRWPPRRSHPGGRTNSSWWCPTWPPQRTGSGRPRGPCQRRCGACRRGAYARRQCPGRGAVYPPGGRRAPRTSATARTSTPPAWARYLRPLASGQPLSWSVAPVLWPPATPPMSPRWPCPAHGLGVSPVVIYYPLANQRQNQ